MEKEKAYLENEKLADELVLILLIFFIGIFKNST